MSNRREQRGPVTNKGVRYNDEWDYVRTKVKCPKCHSEMITEVNKNRSVVVKYCSNEHCDYGLSEHMEFA
jgi:ssDNA-binding Zn-finger/Zn-ribbon topoisomerase 1